MAADLVSGVLSAIEQRELEHHRAARELQEAARLKVSSQFGDYILGTIADGMRLCRSLRDIVERYQKAWGRRNTGTADEQALRQMYAIAMIDVLSDLAHGLGVEVDTPAETVIQFTGTPSNFDEVCRFLGTQQHGHREEGYGPDAHMLLYTDDGQVRVGVSDWVARRDDGSFEVLSEEAVAGGLGIEDTP